MKLYATIKSERATKTQGGNNYLLMELALGRTNARKIYLNATYIKEDNVFCVHFRSADKQMFLIFNADTLELEDKKDNHHPFVWNCDCSQCLPERMRQSKGKRQKGECANGYELPCEICPKDGKGNCTT